MPVLLTSRAQIKVNGAELAPDVQDLLMSWVVDDSVGMAGMFAVTFRDPDHTVLTKGKFKLGTPMTIGVHMMEEAAPELIMDGEVTAIETEYAARDGSVAVVRGLDRAHRLFRGRKNLVFTNVKASDLARKVAALHGLTPMVDATTTVFEKVAQVGESDWQFLKRLAAEAGREVSVEARKLLFKKPGPPPGLPIKLTMGQNLVNFRATVTAAEQVKTVEARSFDSLQERVVTAKQPVKGGATTGTTLAKVSSAFPNQDYVISRPFATQAQAMAVATAVASDVAENHAELHGEVGGDPSLRAGSAIKLEGAGPAFVGTYRVSATRHRFDGRSGYTTEFSVAGRRENSLLGLTSGGPRATSMPGLMVAIVIDNTDPLAIGRVKIKIPTLADDFATDWAQVVYPGAGGTTDKRGLCMVPAVNDEVLVGFEMGDVNRPFVLGGLYTSKQKPHLTGLTKVGATLKRSLTTHSGMKITLDDTPGAEQITIANKLDTVKIEVVAAAGRHMVRITSDKDVEVKALGNATVDVTGNVAVKSLGNTTVAATGNLELSGMMVKITAQGPMELKGAIIKLN